MDTNFFRISSGPPGIVQSTSIGRKPANPPEARGSAVQGAQFWMMSGCSVDVPLVFSADVEPTATTVPLPRAVTPASA
jgi:hypothetical protein